MADMVRVLSNLAIIALLLGACDTTAVETEKPRQSDKQARSVYAGGALDAYCSHAGKSRGGHQFIMTCPMKVASPDGNAVLVQSSAAGEDEAYQVFLQDKSGQKIGDVPGLNDGFPFVLYWSPKPGWFIVNHWVGSFMERPKVFEIRKGKIIEHNAFQQNVQQLAADRYPCLKRLSGDWMNGTAWKWSKDGTRFAAEFYTRTDSCFVEHASGKWLSDGNWEPLTMIINAQTGDIEPDSVRVQPARLDDMPTDGPYAEF